MARRAVRRAQLAPRPTAEDAPAKLTNFHRELGAQLGADQNEKKIVRAPLLCRQACAFIAAGAEGVRRVESGSRQGGFQKDVRQQTRFREPLPANDRGAEVPLRPAGLPGASVRPTRAFRAHAIRTKQDGARGTWHGARDTGQSTRDTGQPAMYKGHDTLDNGQCARSRGTMDRLHGDVAGLVR